MNSLTKIKIVDNRISVLKSMEEMVNRETESIWAWCKMVQTIKVTKICTVVLIKSKLERQTIHLANSNLTIRLTGVTSLIINALNAKKRIHNGYQLTMVYLFVWTVLEFTEDLEYKFPSSDLLKWIIFQIFKNVCLNMAATDNLLNF